MTSPQALAPMSSRVCTLRAVVHMLQKRVRVHAGSIGPEHGALRGRVMQPWQAALHQRRRSACGVCWTVTSMSREIGTTPKGGASWSDR